MRTCSGLAALLILAACGKPAEPAKSPNPGLEVKSGVSWLFGMGPNSVEITYLDTPGAQTPKLRLVCAKGAGFLVVASDLASVSSEERLTIGAGDIAHTLVATKATVGVQASGPIDDELLSIFDGSGPISINHGSQNVGPFEPPAAVRRVFAETCRKLRARGQA